MAHALARPPTSTVGAVRADELAPHVGKQVCMPNGWHTLAGVDLFGVVVHVHTVEVGPDAHLTYPADFLLGVRGDPATHEPCGCLLANVEQFGHVCGAS